MDVPLRRPPDSGQTSWTRSETSGITFVERGNEGIDSVGPISKSKNEKQSHGERLITACNKYSKRDWIRSKCRRSIIALRARHQTPSLTKPLAHLKLSTNGNPMQKRDPKVGHKGFLIGDTLVNPANSMRVLDDPSAQRDATSTEHEGLNGQANSPPGPTNFSEPDQNCFIPRLGQALPPSWLSSDMSQRIQTELLEPLITQFLENISEKVISDTVQPFGISGPETEESSASDNDEPTDCASETEDCLSAQVKRVAPEDRSLLSLLIDTFCDSSGRDASSSGSSRDERSAQTNGSDKQEAASSQENRQKRRRTGNSASNAEGDHENYGESDGDERAPQKKSSDGSVNDRNLACPFYQRRPHATPRATACIHPGFKTIARLKEHLYRQHYRIACPRCERAFKDEESLIKHLKAEVICDSVEGSPDVEFMTSDQKRQLRSKKRKQGEDTRAKKWESIYRLLFPDDSPPVPSPYCDSDGWSSKAPSFNQLEDFQSFSYRQLRILLLERMQSELRSLGPTIELRLKEAMEETMHEAQGRILRQWQEQKSTSQSRNNCERSMDESRTSRSGSEVQPTMTEVAAEVPVTDGRLNVQRATEISKPKESGANMSPGELIFDGSMHEIELSELHLGSIDEILDGGSAADISSIFSNSGGQFPTFQQSEENLSGIEGTMTASRVSTVQNNICPQKRLSPLFGIQHTLIPLEPPTSISDDPGLFDPCNWDLDKMFQYDPMFHECANEFRRISRNHEAGCENEQMD